MRRTKSFSTVIAMITFSFLLCGAAQSQDCETVPGNVIENCSFEADVVAPGNTMGGTPTGWFAFGPGGPTDWGVGNLGMTGTTGDNTGFIDPVSGGSTANQVCQKISLAMQSGVTYTVRGDVCRPAGNTLPANYWIALRRSNSQIIKKTNAAPAGGACEAAAEVSFVATGADVGNELRVCISNIATSSNPGTIHFDNIVATPVDLKSFSIE